ncbi:MAG: fimbrillin family protein [Alistipes sp.]
MKKFLLSMSLMFVALTLTSCAKDAAEENVVPAGKGFSFVADIDGTRATVDGMKTVWESGDQVAFGGVTESSTYTTCRLYGYDYVSGNKFSNDTRTFTEANQFYAVWPSSLDASGYIEVYTTLSTDEAKPAHRTAQYFNVGYNKTAGVVQNGATAAHVPAVAPMYWKSEGAISPEGVAVQFHHATTLMKFTVKNAEDADITIESLRFSVPTATKICGTYYINLATGELVSSGSSYVYNAATVEVTNATPIAKDGTFDVYMPLAPFALNAGDEITILVSTTDGATCTFQQTIASNLTFEAGKLNTKTIEFHKDAVVAEQWTVDQLYAAIEGGTVAFTGKTVKGYVSAMAVDNTHTLSNGTLIITSNSGNAGSAVKLFNSTGDRVVDAEGLFVGAEVIIALDNATVATYAGFPQLTDIVADDLEIQSDKVWSIVPVPVTIAEYNADYAKYQNVYLAFENVEPIQDYAAANSTSIKFTDGTNELLVYNNSRWTAGASCKIAKQQGTLYGLGQAYNTTAEITNTDVKQLAAFAPACVLSAESLSFTANNGTAGSAPEVQTVTATLATGCTLGTISADADWVTVLPADDSTILVSVAENTGAERSATITVNVMKDAAVAAVKTIAVTQKAPGAAAEATETITMSALGLTNAQDVTAAPITKGDITITFSKGSNSNAPKYYTSGTAIRAYGGNTFTISAGGKTITKVEITFGANDGTNAITTNVGTFESPTWTGNATDVVFTIGGTTGNRRLSVIKVTYE